MKEMHFQLTEESLTSELASRFIHALQAPAVLGFSGEIGAGKTTFIRAMLQALGITSAIKSPTFSLVESYQCKDLLIHHFDLYRIEDDTELEYIGFRDYFSDESICCIEWPERVHSSLLPIDLQFSLSIQGDGRIMKIKSLSDTGDKILTGFADNHEQT